MSIEKLKAILRVCDEIQDSTLEAEEKYDLIFSAKVSTQAFSLCREMGVPLDYYDPDTTYEEDTRAFVAALRAYIYNCKENFDDNTHLSYYQQMINKL